MPKALQIGDTVQYVPAKTFSGEPKGLSVQARVANIHQDGTLDLHTHHPSVKGGIAEKVTEDASGQQPQSWHRE